MTPNIISNFDKAAPALLAFAFLAGTTCMAQAGATGSAAANASASSTPTQAMTSVDATLRSSVDSRHAKAGDAVTAVTRSKTTLANGTTLPKGTQITGHVTDVTQYSKAAGQGAVSMIFDQARIKDGTAMPIHAVLRGITPPVTSVSDSSDMDAMTPVGTASAGTSGGGGVAPGGGGLLRGTSSTVSGLTRTSAQAIGNVAGAATQTTGNAFHTVGSTVNGIALSPSANASASGTLSSSGHDVHLQNGATLSMDISAQ